ncbi:retrovirus-related Pol polyprotein from transposon opus [Trichonephila clavipes]|nr:retrovirus-related Pol polyprotein from transposon opus [Trichonephila clavipes]
MRQIGKCFAGAFKLCSTLNLPRLTKTVYKNQEAKLLKAVQEVAEKSMIKVAAEIVEKKQNLSSDIVKCGISVDGTWHGVGIGAVLNQNQRPIAFASRTLNKVERNYTVTERECLVVIWALNKFKTYFGSLPVKVITDHAALTKLTNGKNLSSRMIRWALKLSEFDIEWEHRPGVQNIVADVLSRNPVGNLDRSQISCAALQALALNSREQLIPEQRECPALGYIYRF